MDVFTAHLLAIAAFILSVWGTVSLYATILREGLAWFLFCILVPPLGLILFACLNARAASRPIAFILFALALAFIAQSIYPQLYDYGQYGY